MIQHYLTSPNIKNIIKLRKIAYLGAKFFLAPCFFMLVCAFSWEQRKLGEVCPITMGQSPDGTTYSDTPSDYILVQGNADLKNGWVCPRVWTTQKTKTATAGDLIMSVRAPAGAMGKTAYDVVLGRGVAGIKGNEFIYQSLAKMDADGYWKKLAAGSTFESINSETVCKAEIVMPQDIDEQQQIGTYFKHLDNLITLHQRECFSFDFGSRSAKVAQKTISWEQRKVGELTVESSEYTTLEAGFPLLTSSRNGLMYQNEYRGKQTTDSTETMFSIVPLGACTYRHMSDDDVFHLNVNRLEKGLVSREYPVFYASDDNNLDFIVQQINSSAEFRSFCAEQKKGGTRTRLYYKNLCEFQMLIPNTEEQEKIATFLLTLDTLITLHQREPPKEDKILNDIKTDTLFHEYYCQWLVIYKEGSVRGVTMQKYHLTAEWVKKLIPDVKLCDFDRITYQQLINDYAETHERQTTMDFHHQLKGAILDAVDDGLIARDPTRKVIIKGKSPNDKKKKYLSRYELQKLLTSLDLNSGLNMDWLILLIAKTGMRFSEAIAVTPMDFDFTHQTLSVNKTWDYKGEGGFQPTKNKSSVRKIRLDWQTVGQFYAIVRELNDTAPIFVSKEKKIYNSTLNDVLERHCKAVGIPTISVHGLRHTHASLLLFDGVSIASVAQRLGHSSINTTQKTYLHIIRELENKDIDLIMKSISSLLD